MAAYVEFDIRIDTRQVDRILQIAPGLSNVLEHAMVSALAILQGEVKDRVPVDMGFLKASIRPEIWGSGAAIAGRLSSNSRYGAAVETGRKPGRMPPPDALEGWVQRIMGVPPEDAPDVAFLLARKIGREGTEGAHMFRDGLAAAKPAIEQTFEDAIRILIDTGRQGP